MTLRFFASLTTTSFCALLFACASDPESREAERGKSDLALGSTPADCPAVMAPPADFCGGDEPRPKQDERGCVTGFECPTPCPAVMAPPADLCGGDEPLPKQDERGCVTGFECPAPCPAVMAPPASECPGGTWTPRENPRGCVTGFDCVK